MADSRGRAGAALTIVMGLALGLAPAASAQEAAPADPVAPGSPDRPIDPRIEELRREVQTLRAEVDAMGQKPKEKALSGWQFQLRGGWFTLAHNHRNDILSGDDHQHGWAVGIGLAAPLWTDEGPVDLLAHLSIDYRQVAYSTVYTSALTAQKGTISYLNIVACPMVRFALTDAIRPFVLAGLNMQVATPPTDAVTYLDLGVTVGLGLDFKVHERISVGFDYRYSWFGVGDQEDEDFGLLSAYVGFNF